MRQEKQNAAPIFFLYGRPSDVKAAIDFKFSNIIIVDGFVDAASKVGRFGSINPRGFNAAMPNDIDAPDAPNIRIARFKMKQAVERALWRFGPFSDMGNFCT